MAYISSVSKTRNAFHNNMADIVRRLNCNWYLNRKRKEAGEQCASSHTFEIDYNVTYLQRQVGSPFRQNSARVHIPEYDN
jgi:hypothetical protein